MNLGILTHTYISTLRTFLAGNVLGRILGSKILWVALFMVCSVGMPQVAAAQVTLSGTVYSDAGTTPQAVSKTISVAVGTSTVGRYSTTTTVTSGAWTITIPLGHGIATGTRILVWVDNDATTRASVLTKANSSATAFSITGLDLYRNRVIARHEASSATSTTNTDFSFYTSAQDADLQHSTSTLGVTIAAGNELYVWAGKTLAPGGNLTVAGNASSSATDGSMYLAGTSVYTAGGTLTLSGSLTAISTATFTGSTFTTFFVATTTGKIINAPLASIGNVTFNGLAGGWTFTGAATTSAFTLLQGTVVAPSTTLGVTGIFQNDGTFNHNGGTLNIVGAVSSALGNIATYVAGRDTSGSATGTGTTTAQVILSTVNNAVTYIGKTGSSTLCNPSIGNADACELIVLDSSSTTNPTFITARDSAGSNASTSAIGIRALAISGNTLYVAKDGSVDACNNTAGTAAGCELMIFDISSTTNPVYVRGIDAGGNATGTQNVNIVSLGISGTTLYVGKAGSSTTCSPVVGSAGGCELLVFDISSTSNPAFITARDSAGSNASTSAIAITSLAVSGTKLYVAKAGSSDVCNNVAGTAAGCELMVFDIASTTNPTYASGRDVSGSSAGTGNLAINFILATGTTVYVGKAGDGTTCSQTAGSAIGCELMAFDISSTTSPTYVRGVDVAGSATGIQNSAINSLLLYKNYLYVANAASFNPCAQGVGLALGCELTIFDVSSSSALRMISSRDSSGDTEGAQINSGIALSAIGNSVYFGKSGDAAACSQVVGSAGAAACELMVFDVTRAGAGILMGTLDAASSLGNLVASGTVEFRDNASASNLTVVVGTTTAPAVLTIGGNYSNQAAFVAGENAVVFSSASAQTISGNLTGSNTLYRAQFMGGGTKTFSSNASATIIEIAAGATVVAPNQLTVSDTFTNGGTFTATGTTLNTFGFGNEFVSAHDSAGGLNAVGASSFEVFKKLGSIVYVGKSISPTACSQIAGSAVGCELMVFDISSSTNPTYVAGRDSSGSANGTANVGSVDALAFSGNNQVLYVGKSGNATACNPTIGNARSCELMVFDISSTTNPTFITALDSSGNNASTSLVAITDLRVSGNFLYVSKAASTAACNNTAGTAAGCELMVFDISSTTNPIYISGLDSTGSATSTGGSSINNIEISGNNLYATKGADGTACSQVAGSAVGCELMIFNIASATNPVYIAGRDSAGNATGTGSLSMQSLSVQGSLVYVSKFGSGLSCTNSPGTASGCELMVFDISSSTNPTYVTGRDTSGSAGGTSNNTINSVIATGTNLYVGKNGNSTACSQTAGSAIGCELMVFDISSSTNPTYIVGRDSGVSFTGVSSVTVLAVLPTTDLLLTGRAGDLNPCESTTNLRFGCELIIYNNRTTLSGTLTGASALASVISNGRTAIMSTASTTNLTIATSSEFQAPATDLSLSENFTNNGSFLANNGEVILHGTNQTLSSVATTTFYDLTQQTTAAATTTFSTSSPFVITRNLTLNGTSTAPLKLRSVSPGTQWRISPQSTSTISLQYLDVRDSNNISTATTSLYCSPGCVNNGNNTNWTFILVGSTTLASHGNGQVANAFTSRDKINESLFAFQLVPNSGTATVTNMIIALSGVTNIIPGDFSNLRLLRDQNNNGQYDATDVAVGGAGALVISGENGTLTFIDDFLSTTTINYIVVGDWNAPANGSLMTFALTASNITVIDGNPTHVVTGTVSSIQHRRNNKGGGGGNSNVGEPAPAGAGIVSGGGNTGGEVIGSDPDFVVPTSNSGLWNNGANAYDGTDGTYATSSSAANHSYANHGFGIPSGNTISGIVVKLEISGSTAAGTVDVELSWNGGTNWTSVKTTPTLTTADSVRTLGSPSDLWGRTWTSAEFANGNLSVRLTGAPSANTIQLDAIQVRVYHTTGGGGAGGGAGGGGI